MFNVIVATTKNLGIGFNNIMPWNISEELKLFANITENSVIIVGRKTAETLPHLKNREVICVSRSSSRGDALGTRPSGYMRGVDKNNCVIKHSISEAVKYAQEKFPNKKIFVAGGAQIYREVLMTQLIKDIDTLYISILRDEYFCDTFLYINMDEFSIMTKKDYEKFTAYQMRYTPTGERNYLELLKDILKNGDTRIGRNGETKSLFTKHLSFDLRNGFPLLTTKKMFFRGIVEELLFFIRGNTDSSILENKGIKIWKGNTSREFLDSLGMTSRKVGDMGPMYGYQWRFFDAEYDEEKCGPKEATLDQLANVIKEIKENPSSRRILLTTFNPKQANQGVLYPCHSIIIQFYVQGDYLDMFCYNRSQDLFLGVPFNIASSALLLSLVAKSTNLVPRNLNITMGDVHIYKEHYELAEKQSILQPFVFPKLKINKDKNIFDDLIYDDFTLENYQSHEAIKTEMKA